MAISPVLKALSSLDPELRGKDRNINSLARLADLLVRFVPTATGVDVQQEVRHYNADIDPFLQVKTTCPRGTDVLAFWMSDFMVLNYPGLYAVAKATFSIFHGPKVESTFSEMAGILDKKRGALNVETYSAYQTIRYYLRARNKKSVEFFHRDNVKFGKVDKPLCWAIRQGWRRNQARQAKNKTDKEMKRILYGVQAPVTLTEAKKRLKKDAKRAHLVHKRQMRRKTALEKLAQVKKTEKAIAAWAGQCNVPS